MNINADIEKSEAIIHNILNSPEEAAEKAGRIGQRIMAESRWLKEPNFKEARDLDLRRLYELYDETFFEGFLARRIEETESKLSFKFSTRMTQLGGKTEWRRYLPIKANEGKAKAEYRILIAANLLFGTFKDIDRQIVINGIVCNNRLEALQRIFEHELLHLCEHLLYGASSCAGGHFKIIANRIFGHTGATHQLVTQRERALVNYGLKTGDEVNFAFEGKTYKGIINRITKRATVLVESPSGRLYSNGKKYVKFYVPLKDLTAIK